MNTTNPTDAVSILRKDLQDLCSYIPDNCPALHQRMRKALAATERAAIQPAGDAEPAAWIRKTDITEWTDTEPETDGWTPLYLAPAAPVQAAPDAVAWISTNRVSGHSALAYDKITSSHDSTLYSHQPLYTHPAAPVQAAPDARKLQWSLPMPPNSEIGYDYVSAQTPFGRILITWEGWKDDPAYRIDEHPIEPAVFWTDYSLAETVAYAEDQYLAAIGSAAPAAQAASRDDQCKTCGKFVCCDHAPAVQAAPVGICTGCGGGGMVGNIIEQDTCPFCKGSGDETAPEVKASELPPLPEPEYDYYDIKGYDEGQMHAYGQACIDNERVSAAQWKSLYDAAIQVAESGKVIAGVRERLGIASELPPLPQPVRMSSDQSYLGYTADQLHAYVLADRAARASELPSIGEDAEFKRLSLAVAHAYLGDASIGGAIFDLAQYVNALLLAARSPVAAPQPDVSARDAALEEAANVCDREADRATTSPGNAKADACARRIRALKSAAPESAEPSADTSMASLHPVNQVEIWADDYAKEGGYALIVQMLRCYAGLLRDRQRRATSSAAKGEAQ